MNAKTSRPSIGRRLFLGRRTPLGRQPYHERVRLSRKYTRKHRRVRRLRINRIEVGVRVAALSLLFGAGILLAEQAGAAAGAAAIGVQEGIAQLLPVEPTGGRPDATPAPALLSGAPILDSLPMQTNDPRLTISGRLPPHIASMSDRPRVELLLNGSLVAVPPLDAQGRFSATVTLVDGPNLVAAAAARIGERLQNPPSTVVLDRTPPELTVTSPVNNAEVEGPSLKVEGRTEKGAFVSVNGHAVAVTPDNAFVDSLEVTPGNLVIEVVARDRAGNETKRTIRVRVRQPSTTAGLTVSVSLDRAVAPPGARVTAEIIVTAGGEPLRDASVTVYVGRPAVGSGTTDRSGRLRVSFSAPSIEGFYQVVALATAEGQPGRGSALLEVRR